MIVGRMKLLNSVAFITFLFVISVKASDKNGGDVYAYEQEYDDFVATTEWQTLKPGQRIPRGLHVRMDLESGKKEAKLMDGNNDLKSSKALAAVQSEKDDVEAAEDIRESLRKITDDGGSVKQDNEQKFRSIDELKKDFDALNMKMTTESEIIVRFVEELKLSDVTTQRKIDILLELEYYVHQFDNARDFVKLGGFDIVIPFLESTSEDVRISTAFLLGSSMQSNPSVQVSASERGLIEKLLNRLNTDLSVAVQNKALYALSCLLRRFPHAQEKFLELDGLSIVTSFFEKYGREINRLQLKTVTMVYDLVVEDHLTAEAIEDKNSLSEEKSRQYGRVGMKRAVIEAKWCDIIPKLLNSTDHDMIEKVLKMMALISNDCRIEFLSLRHRLSVLRDEFSSLVDRDEDASYLYELLQTVVTLLKELEESSRDEL